MVEEITAGFPDEDGGADLVGRGADDEPFALDEACDEPFIMRDLELAAACAPLANSGLGSFWRGGSTLRKKSMRLSSCLLDFGRAVNKSSSSSSVSMA